MPIAGVVGKPGAGKGLLLMRFVEETLRQTTRPIITNFALELKPWVNGNGQPQIGLLEYLKRKHGTTFNAEGRIFLLTDEQIAKFYLYRAVPVAETQGKFELRSCKITKSYVDKKTGREVILEFDSSLYDISGPCVYMVDEGWKFWGSRCWQETGEGVLFYSANCCRKSGDDLYIATQHTKQVDTAIWRVAQEFWRCKNRSYLRMGLFQQPKDIRVGIFEDPPTNGQSQEPMNTFTFRPDVKGQAQCYDTTKGVGLAGRMQGDIGKKKRGIPWIYIYPAFVLFIVCVWFVVSKGLMSVASGAVQGFVPEHSVPVAGKTNGVRESFSEKVAKGFLPSHSLSAVTNDVPEAEPIYMVGKVVFGTKGFVSLSNGETFKFGDGRLEAIYDRGCVVDGITYHQAPIGWKPASRLAMRAW